MKNSIQTFDGLLFGGQGRGSFQRPISRTLFGSFRFTVRLVRHEEHEDKVIPFAWVSTRRSVQPSGKKGKVFVLRSKIGLRCSSQIPLLQVLGDWMCFNASLLLQSACCEGRDWAPASVVPALEQRRHQVWWKHAKAKQPVMMILFAKSWHQCVITCLSE